MHEESCHSQAIGFVDRLRKATVLGIVVDGVRLHGVGVALEDMFAAGVILHAPVEVQLLEDVLVVEGTADDEGPERAIRERDLKRIDENEIR